MKRTWAPGGRSIRKVGYNVIEIQKSGHTLSEAVDSGVLTWFKNKYCPMEAVTNVWEGDEGMMKHVPKFPMPPCVEGYDPTGRKSDAELLQRGDMETGKASTNAHTEFALELKRRGMERKFWIKMAKVVMSIESLNQSTMALRNKFCQVNMKIKKHDCQHLLNLYTQLQKIKDKLDKADEDYKKNKFTDLFVTMPPSKKTWFKRQHQIQGKLPNNMGCIVKKYSFVRTKLREIVHQNFERLNEFKDILAFIMKDAFMKFNKDSLALNIFTEAEGNKNGDASCVGAEKVDENTDEGLDEEGNCKKAKLDNVEDAIMSLEDIFWENMTTMKKMMHKAATTLGRIDKATLPDDSNVFKKNGSLMCRQMINIRKSIISFNDILAKLKEEMQCEKYEDKKLFTAEMLASEGIEGLTIDNSLLVVEALLNQLKDNYLRVQDEKYFVLEKFGYSKDVQLVAGPKCNDENVPLVRMCTHSRTEVDIKVIARLAEGESYKKKKKGKKGGSTLAACEKINQTTASPDAGTGGQQNLSAGGTKVTPSGDLSSAGGTNVTPSGDLSSAGGTKVTPSGDLSSAGGTNVTPSGDLSSAGGTKVTPSGDLSSAGGTNITPSGDLSSAGGTNVTPSGDLSSAGGTKVTPSGDLSSAGGTNGTPSGDLSSEQAAGNKDVNAGVETCKDVAVDRSTGDDDDNSAPMDDNAEDDEACDESSEDDSNICKNVNSMAFFMSTLPPDAFTVNVKVQSPVSTTTEDFIEKEKQYWDRLQTLLLNVDKHLKQIRNRAKNNFLRKRQIRDSMKALHYRAKKLSGNFEFQKDEAYRAGYCTHVVYENLEYCPESSTSMLVKSFDQIEQRIDSMYRCYKETTKKLGVPWMFKI